LPIFITGQLSGGGGVIADELHFGLPPAESLQGCEP
jgi:hypothetical protein